MAEKQFIVLFADEDGGFSIDYMTAKQIKEDYLSEDENPYTFFTGLPNLGYDSGILIIDGTIVVPKPKKVVKDWKI